MNGIASADPYWDDVIEKSTALAMRLIAHRSSFIARFM
jgi:hypothetical protein